MNLRVLVADDQEIVRTGLATILGAQDGIEVVAEAVDGRDAVEQARRLERAGAAMLDFTNSGAVAGAAVTGAVAIPVIGGLGGGPWLDGRVRALANAVGYSAAALDDAIERYANVARATLEAFTAYASDVRAGRQVLGEPTTQAAPPSATPHGTGR